MRVVYFILLVFFVAGCSPKNKIPAGVLSPQKMRFILWDLIRVDEYANNFLLSNTSIDINDEKLNLYQQIFKIHSTKSEIFKKSLTFYQSNPDLLKVIVDSLRKDEQRVLQEQYKPNPVISDTLTKDSLSIKPMLIN